MTRVNRVCGEYPKTLIRFFKEEKYAHQFVKEGKFRISLLSVYRGIECNVRRDATEGEGRYKLNGPVTMGRFSPDSNEGPIWSEVSGMQNYHTESLNQIFLFCASNVSVDVNNMKAKLGKYAVKIVSPVSLAIELDYYLNGAAGLSGFYHIEGRNVEYTKGQFIKDGRTPDELTDLAYTQKPARYRREKEYRFCILGRSIPLAEAEDEEDNSAKKYLDIDLGSGRNSYAQFI